MKNDDDDVGQMYEKNSITINNNIKKNNDDTRLFS